MDGIISANTTSRVESSANGMTFFGSLVSWVAGLVLLSMLYLGWKVSKLLDTHLILFTQWNRDATAKGASGELTVAFYLASGAWPVLCSSWVVWNREAQRFVLRRLGWRRPGAWVTPTPPTSQSS